MSVVKLAGMLMARQSAIIRCAKSRHDVAQHLHVLAERQPFLEHPLPFGERGMDVEDEIAAGLGDVVVEVDHQPKPHHVNSVGRASARTCSSRSLSGAWRRRSIRAN